MFSHINIGIKDFDRAFAFYSALLAPLNLQLKFNEPENFWAGWKAADADRPLLLIGRPFDGQPAAQGNGQMVALLAPNRATVDTCYAIALQHGGTDEGAPGLRPHYHAHYYGAYFRDPEGNKLCVCCHNKV